MTVIQFKRLIILFLVVLLSFQSFGFAEKMSATPKLRTGEEIRLEIQKAIEAIQTLKIDIRNHTERIRLRIEKVKRNLSELIKSPGSLEDDQINDLKDIAKNLEQSNGTIKSGLETIKELQLKIKAAVDAKERKALLPLYRELYMAQKAYLLELRGINETLLSDLERLLEIKAGR